MIDLVSDGPRSMSPISDLPSLSSLSTSIGTPEGTPTFVFGQGEDMTCTVCKDLLRNALQLPCGHHVCPIGYNEIFGENDRGVCPVEDCKSPCTKSEVFPDACKRRDIANLEVYCSFRELGCKVQVAWRCLANHEVSCKFRCEICPECNLMVPSSEIHVHALENCPNRPIPCAYCSERIGKSDMEEHVRSECRLVPLDCPNQCGSALPREQMPEHLPQCPQRKIACSYAERGCSFEGNQEDLEKHMRESVLGHLDMLKNRMSTSEEHTSTRLNEMKTALVPLLRNHEQAAKLTEENGKLRNECKANKKQIQDLKKLLASYGEKHIQATRSLEDKASLEKLDKLKNDVIVMRETVQGSNQRLTSLERTGPTGGAGGSRNVEEVERQVGLLDVRMSSIQLRLQLLETVNTDGVLMWKIRDYRRRKQEAISGKALSLFSQPFYTGQYGYKLCGRVYLNGDGSGKGTYLSFFLVVMKGEYDALLPWPFTLPVTLKLLDQKGTFQHVTETFRPNPNSNSFQKPQTEMNVACGVPCFAAHDKLETDTYMKDDTIFLRAVLDCTAIPVLY